ncbi:MAG TPA: efflux RND transporter periplasmic adaptor subunit [Pyrinomonadaceae bacterium]|nr:efflux RND transporter periplasmic adaptor subunit [Pyrinomonadaceae bacterium]
MSEENKNIIEVEEKEKAEESNTSKPKRNLKPLYIALLVLGIVVLGTLLLLIFRGRQGGDVVPAPRSVSFDESSNQETSVPAEGQTVTLSPEQVERIKLKIETVGETMSAEAAQVSATGVVQPNAYSETPVISLVGGVVRKIGSQLGENVSKGQTIAVIFSDELAASQSRYLSLQTEVQTARQNYERAGKLVQLNPVSRSESDEAQAKLKTKEAELDEMQRRYNRTTKLVEIGASSREELEQDRTKLKTAEAEVEQARKQLTRTAEIVKLNPVSRAGFEEATVKLRTAESELAGARQRLILLGLSEQRVNALRSPSQISSEIALTAPVSGTITSRSVNQSEVIEANKELFKVTNLSSVWVIAQVYEKDLGRMRTGSGASISSDAFQGKLFRGQVTYIDPNINQETRTAQVRVELDNPGQIFKIGMYVKASFGALGTGESTVPVIPLAAVQNMKEQKIVFAATDKPNVFVMKPVRLGSETNGRYVVLEGLNVGDKVVTDGSFLLRAEMLKQNPTHQH